METALISTPDLRLVWVAAQRVSGDEKIATSIRKVSPPVPYPFWTCRSRLTSAATRYLSVFTGHEIVQRRRRRVRSARTSPSAVPYRSSRAALLANELSFLHIQIPFIGGATGVGALGLLQSDIVAVYNFEDPGKVLLSKTVLNTLWEVATGLPVKWLVSAVGVSLPHLDLDPCRLTSKSN